MGRTSTIVATLHFSRLLRRYCRRRAISRDDPFRPTLYSLSHCFTMIPMEAEARLDTRLENHRMFSRTANAGGLKGDTVAVSSAAER